jgi:hypothetical protein
VAETAAIGVLCRALFSGAEKRLSTQDTVFPPLQRVGCGGIRRSRSVFKLRGHDLAVIGVIAGQLAPCSISVKITSRISWHCSLALGSSGAKILNPRQCQAQDTEISRPPRIDWLISSTRVRGAVCVQPKLPAFDKTIENWQLSSRPVQSAFLMVNAGTMRWTHRPLAWIGPSYFPRVTQGA